MQKKKVKEEKMKIQCDVCEKDKALVFCTADEAALCEACDHRVHHANELASKHQRFSLLQNQFPVCDICQKRRGFLFCQQDRAILCIDCDLSIHAVNEHTKKHDRFLLTGLTLSPTLNVGQPLFENEKTATVSHSSVGESSTTTTMTSNAPIANNEGGETTRSISDYLIETQFPGWHFDEYLDSSSHHFGFCKSDFGDGRQNFEILHLSSTRRDRMALCFSKCIYV